ncbi:hypothetical protein KY289_021246 [Solanum tuberosum]|nr:hypothetical protein KY284_021093 [Solanum tuberosum]KAH0683494.1 hypothetical protein KY289_021246 [Solanum tuberosum]
MTQALEGGANENSNPETNQVLVAGETQVVPEESIRTRGGIIWYGTNSSSAKQALEGGANENSNPKIIQVLGYGMENLNYPKNEEPQNTHIGPAVELSRNVETSNGTKEASDPPGDKLVLGSQLPPQQEEAESGDFDYSAKLQTQNRPY